MQIFARKFTWLHIICQFCLAECKNSALFNRYIFFILKKVVPLRRFSAAYVCMWVYMCAK